MTSVPYTEKPAVRTDWETPQAIFDELNEEFGFQTDLCALPGNNKLQRYFTPEQDALKQTWSGMCWMNPPYGKEIADFVKKAYDSACEGSATVVCLLPARSNNEWWKYVIKGEVRFIRKKLQFVGAPFVSMFPNVVVIFHAHLDPGGIMKTWLPRCMKGREAK